MKYLYLTLILISISLKGSSQGEYNIWYFGEKAGLNFNSGFPVVLTNCNSPFYGWPYTVTVSDSLGNLLFYADWSYVYNRNNQVMPNGSLLGPGQGCIQPDFVVKKMDQDSVYYLFNMDSWPYPGHMNPIGLSYTIVDMRLDGGLGDIPSGQTGIPVPGAEVTDEMLTGTRAHNNKDAWIVARQYTGNKYYFSYHITIAGIDPVPVISTSLVPLCFGCGAGFMNGPWMMRFSPDGNRLVVIYDTIHEFCQFNSSTGEITPLILFHTGPYLQTNFPTAEFSIDNKFLYVTASNGSNGHNIYQYDAQKTDSAQFKQSEILIHQGIYESQIQRGPDHKIYCTHLAMDSLDVINNPSAQGVACNFQRNTIYLEGRNSLRGFVQFLERYYVYIHHTGPCVGNAVDFTSTLWPQADSLHWDFGDPASGPANFSFNPNPSHTYSLPGSYTVTLFVRHIDKRTDTAWQVVTIHPTYKPTLGADQSVCLGTSVTFDAGTCSGCTYQWKNLTTMLIVGSGQTYSTSQAGIYESAVTNTFGCVGRDTVQLITNPQPVVTNNPLSKMICSGESTNIALTSNQPGTNYHWTATLTSGNITGFSTDSGLIINQVLVNNGSTAGIVTYNITPKLGGCTGPSVQFPVTVNLGDSVKVSISASANNVCAGTPVTYTATPTNGGTTPTYQWKVNGFNVGGNNPNYTYNPASGDLVSCVMTSSLTTCITNNPATSNQVIMVINGNLPVGVTISPSANPFCPGNSVTFTATPVNGGNNPSYQWKVNGVNAGPNSSTFTYYPISSDQVSSIMTSNLACVSGNPATSNTIVMSGTLASQVTFTRCFDSITTVNAKPFILRGGIPLGGTYSGAGVTNGIFYPAIAGVGTHQIIYTYTNAALCSSTVNYSLLVVNSPTFTCGQPLTDIRDGKTYQTVQIGSQCWMAEDLSYGTEISADLAQRDNCLPEKYHNPASSIQYPASVYQWDEMMNYGISLADQGLCPPAWHVPTEADWNTLFAHYTNNGFAGSPLKYSGFSGFDALLNGARHLNKTWDYAGFATFFWSSTGHGTLKAWAHGLNDPDPSVSAYPALRNNAFSVRCTKDN